jgi:hypothetical protein
MTVTSAPAVCTNTGARLLDVDPLAAAQRVAGARRT